MTKEERAMLREAAEKAKECQRDMSFSGLSDREIHERFIAFEKRSNPAAILSLLDALDGAERDAAELKEHPETWKLVAYFDSEGTADLAVDRIINLAGGIVLTEGPTPKESHD